MYRFKPIRQHLAREGEDYAMRLLHAPGSFPFLEQLTKSGPGMGTGAFRYYTGEMTPGINREKLGYFATSVFWRAGIHTWHQDDNKEISINFTPDERESLRQYMLGNVSFPKNAGLMTFVCSDAASQQIFWMPGENQKTSERVFLLGIRGITFFFSIGDRMPERFAKYCMMNSPGRWITIRDCSKPNTIWTLG